MADSIPTRAQKTAADLKVEWQQLLKNGLCLSQSPTETNESMDTFQCHVEKVFLLYVEVRMAESLGITNWLAAEAGGVELPDRYDQE